MATCIAGARVHVALFDLGRATARAYGGAGFMLAGPTTTVVARRASAWSFAGTPDLDERTHGDVLSLLGRMKERTGEFAAEVELVGHPPQHVGLGSKTALMLSVASAVNAELNAALEVAEIQAVTGRGGASGIGIRGFSTGGFLIDGGHRSDTVADLTPSSGRRPGSPPPVTVRHAMPDHWKVHLLLPEGERRHGRDEIEFFKRVTPVPAPEVFRSVTYAVHELAPAIQEADLPAVRVALENLHSVGFKSRELGAQPQEVRDLLEHFLSKYPTPAGLSSMGPLVYVISDEDGPDSSEVEAEAARCGAAYLGCPNALNQGVEVRP